MNPSRGRPRLSGSAKLIRLRSSVFDLWNQRKTSLGFGNAKNSEFAEFLLHLPSEQTRNIAVEELLQENEPFCSTPLDSHKRRASAPFASSKRQRLPLGSPVESSSKSLDIDVTGTSCSQSRDVDITAESSASAPPVFASGIAGNPYSMLEENNSDKSTVGSEIDSDDDTEFESRMDTIIDELNNSDDTSSDSEEEDMEIYDEADISYMDEEHTITALEDCLDELTRTAIEGVPDDQEEPLLEIDFPECEEITVSNDSAAKTSNSSASAAKVIINSATKTSNETENKVEEKLKESFNLLTSTNALKDMVSLHERPRVIVSVDKLVELCGDKCMYVKEGQLCGAAVTHSTKIVAARAVISWKCCAGHYGKWESSEVLSKNRNENIYLSDCMIAIAILLSGNNYSKFELLAKAMNLKIIGKSAFLNFQRHCALPVVNDMWQKMKDAVIDIIKSDDNLCLCGDGRNDSPGHCARYSVYSLMEHNSKVVVDVEVIDKRECGGNSTIMEREGLRRLLNRLKARVCIKELCTDASTTIIKMIREMKEKDALLKDLMHFLDVWHKAKKLSKSLHKAAKVKGCGDLKAWIEPTVNHFWYCCQNANGDLEKLKKSWLGLLHHVCGEHTWAESSCTHAPETETNIKYLSKSSKAMEALRKIVLDARWLKTLHFYVRFRHTGELENFNSMMTKYVPKRMAFEYPYFIMRVLLAAIDHNMHLFRKPKESKQGQLLGHRKYSKRTQRFHAEFVRQEKDYLYFPFMSARMLKTRADFEGSFSSKADTDEFNPKQIFPTIGMAPPPPTEELLKGPSRFRSKLQVPSDVTDSDQGKQKEKEGLKEKTVLGVIDEDTETIQK